MDFYKIKHPTTQQIFDAILNNEYIPIENMQSKAKQVKVLLMDYWNTGDILVTFTSVTNSGGCPIFLGENDCLYEIASEQKGFFELNEDDQNHEIELLGCYLQTYDKVFNI